MKIPLNELILQASAAHCVVSNLLWRARQAAQEWQDPVFEHWTAQELAGYAAGGDVPSARQLTAHLWSRPAGGSGAWTRHELATDPAARLLHFACLAPVSDLERDLHHCHLWVPLPLDAYEQVELTSSPGGAGRDFDRYLPRRALEALLRHDRQRVRAWAYRRLHGLPDDPAFPRLRPPAAATPSPWWRPWPPKRSRASA